ncbi:Uncharacterised protein [Orientia tsutsugamushi]|nr:Uncharacterised protein [Orientia tsutsugamushi]
MEPDSRRSERICFLSDLYFTALDNCDNAITGILSSLAIAFKL